MPGTLEIPFSFWLLGWGMTKKGVKPKLHYHTQIIRYVPIRLLYIEESLRFRNPRVPILDKRPPLPPTCANTRGFSLETAWGWGPSTLRSRQQKEANMSGVKESGLCEGGWEREDIFGLTLTTKSKKPSCDFGMSIEPLSIKGLTGRSFIAWGRGVRGRQSVLFF